MLGSLYLAYDLLGGQHGPVAAADPRGNVLACVRHRLCARAWIFFGLTAGITAGITLAIEFNRAARGLDHHSLPWEGLFSAIRGVGYGAGLYRILGFR